jgi:excinuclease ABC subunit B
VTPSMQRAIDETNRRRAVQEAYNKEHGITPTTIQKAVRHGIDVELKARRLAREMITASEEEYDVNETLRLLEEEMLEAANNLEFEKAAECRDRIKELKAREASSNQNGSGLPAEAGGDLTAAISQTMANRIGGKDRKAMTPQQTKVKKKPKFRR